MFTSDHFAQAHDEHLHRGIDGERVCRCTRCREESTDVEDGLCIGCRETVAAEESLSEDATFAEVVAERIAGYLARLDADFSIEAAMPWGAQWDTSDALTATVAA